MPAYVWAQEQLGYRTTEAPCSSFKEITLFTVNAAEQSLPFSQLYMQVKLWLFFVNC